MEAEPPKADPPKRKRRWFQFSLRTLMIGVTLLAALSAAVTWVIRDRQRLIRERDEAIERARDRTRRWHGWNVQGRQKNVKAKQRPS